MAQWQRTPSCRGEIAGSSPASLNLQEPSAHECIPTFQPFFFLPGCPTSARTRRGEIAGGAYTSLHAAIHNSQHPWARFRNERLHCPLTCRNSERTSKPWPKATGICTLAAAKHSASHPKCSSMPVPQTRHITASILPSKALRTPFHALASMHGILGQAQVLAQGLFQQRALQSLVQRHGQGRLRLPPTEKFWATRPAHSGGYGVV